MGLGLPSWLWLRNGCISDSLLQCTQAGTGPGHLLGPQSNSGLISRGEGDGWGWGQHTHTHTPRSPLSQLLHGSLSHNEERVGRDLIVGVYWENERR